MPGDRLVYSTDGGRLDRCPRCNRSIDACRCDAPAPKSRGRMPSGAPIDDGIVRIARQRGGRHGKIVTVITGIPGGPVDREKIATALKKLCGSGGTVKDAMIEIQGDQRERVAARLRELGLQVKLVGG